jgi:hypothetical protein
MTGQVGLWVLSAVMAIALAWWLIRRHVTFRSHIDRPNDNFWLMELGVSLSPKARAQGAAGPSPEFVFYFWGRWP